MLTALTDAASRSETDRCTAAAADARLTKQLEDTTAKLRDGFAHAETVRRATSDSCISDAAMLTSF